MATGKKNPLVGAGAKSVGKEEAKSGPKARNATARANEEHMVEEGVPLTPDGRPMARIMFQGAELIPHGQFANISCGPAQIQLWVDPQDSDPIPENVRENLAKGLNDIADVLYGHVLATQRTLIQEAIQAQVAASSGQ